MKTEFATIERKAIDMQRIEQASRILCAGGLVAFPTETVYGLGANGLDEEACKRIYEAKGRPSDNPLILHIANEKQLYQIAKNISPLAKKLMERFCPAPLTLILEKTEIVPDIVTGGLQTVAVRIPQDEIAKALIERADIPIAAPSANLSGKPSPTKAKHVMEDLDGKIDMVLDGGETVYGLESTIIDMSGSVPILLRPGAITIEMLEEVLGKICIPEHLLNDGIDIKIPKAPGMKYKHYAPKASVILVSGEQEAVCKRIQELTIIERANGKKVGILATNQTKEIYEREECGADIILSLGNQNDLKEIGANLFACLREFDAYDIGLIYSEVCSEEAEGLAIMNRLKKASGYQEIRV